MMTNRKDVIALIRDVETALSYIPDEKKLSFLKSKLSTIEDDEAKNILSLIFISGQSIPDVKRDEKVVVMVHGILTDGIWQEGLKETLNSYQGVTAIPLKYGHKRVTSFLNPFNRQKKELKKVKEELMDIIEKNKGKEINVFCHSFGTYLVTKTLQDNPDIKIDKLVMCGGVVRDKFDWLHLKNFPRKDIVINDCGTKDVWPIMAKISSFRYGDSGSIGTQTNKVYDRYHNLKHSEFFYNDFYENFWVPAIVDNTIVNSDWSSKREPPNILMRTIGSFQGLVPWLCILLTLFVICDLYIF